AKACKEAGKAAPLWGPQPAGLPAGGLRKREERCAPPHETRDRRRVGGACGGAGIREHSLLIGSTRNADGAAVTSLGDSRRQDHIGEQATNGQSGCRGGRITGPIQFVGQNDCSPLFTAGRLSCDSFDTGSNARRCASLTTLECAMK